MPQAWFFRRLVLQVESEVGGMDLSNAKRLKALEEENSKLKRLLTDALLDNAALKDVVSRKW